MTRAAVVILNWNGRKYLERFLPGIIENTTAEDTEVIVADNGSDDDSVAWLEMNHPSVRIIRLEKNYGYAGGYNRALAQIDAEFYLLVNSDVMVKAGWAETLITFLELHPNAGACQPKIKSLASPTAFEYAGAAGGFIDKYGYPFCRGRVFDVVEEDRGQYDDPAEIFWASGSCMAVRATAFDQCDGFDDSFFLHMEEIDLCWRMQNAGFIICYVPEAEIFHLGGGTISYDSPSKVYYNFRNNLVMMAKNLPSRHLRRTLFIRMILDGLAAINLLFRSGRAAFSAVVRAHHDYRRAKTAIATFRAMSPHPDMYASPHTVMNKSVVFEYYILGKKKFSDIKWR